MEAIKGFMGKTGVGRRHAAIKYLRQAEPELLALITLRGALDRLSSLPTYQRVARTISSMLEDELHFRHFQELEKARVKEAKAAKEKAWNEFDKAQEIALKNTPNQKRRRVQIKRAADKAGVEWVDWSQKTHMLVGSALLELLIESTGIVQKLKEPDSTFLIVATEETRRWLRDENTRCEALTPVYLPTVIPPRPWDNPWEGGYWTRRVRGIRLIKTNNRPYLEELEGHDLSRVYAPLNAAQRTAWTVNEPVLKIMLEMVETANRYAKAGQDQPAWFPLPALSDLQIPEAPADLVGIKTEDMDEDQKARLKARNAEARIAYKTKATALGKRVALEQTLNAAQKMLPEGEFFIPYQLDFRGRIYAVPSGLNPQGNDLGKALLCFAKMLPISGAIGARWLAVHGAGLWGVDKVSMEAREAWVFEHEAEILASAADPMRNTFWAEADKKSKWQALAFCFEWAGYKRDGYAFESRLAIAQDGTCNGLQNFSAMLLDEVGGAAVNLIPSDKPSDIYQLVADRVLKRVERDAFEGDSDIQRYAQGWLGRVNRSLTKRPVMTLPYGAKRFGFNDQVLKDTVRPWKAAAERGEDAFPWEGSAFYPAEYMGGLIWEEVGEVVKAAPIAMKWLSDAATKAAAKGLPVRWTTPCGLPVQQVYRKTETTSVGTTYGGVKVDIKIQEPTDELDKRKQATALPPNFVHSLDAAHLMRTVDACAADGIDSFALIHDSYGTHAGNAQKMAGHLRAEFVRMYGEVDILDVFKAELEAQMGGEVLPPLPPKGSLDLSPSA